MLRMTNFGIAKVLAILIMVTIMSSIAQANENGISLPQNGSDPVSLHFAEGAVAWEDAKALEILQVFVGATTPCCEGRTPVAGRYVIQGASLSFTSAFGFEPGQDYVVRIRISGEVERLLPFRVKSQAAQIDAAVTQIFPSGDTLPENVLRFYIHFSTPMTPHVAFDFIKLRDAPGNVDDAAFMRFKQELWNEDRKRLTVLMDPGRIKREVATNLELGPALREGQQYTLSVGGGWPSADGVSVLPAFSKEFTVTAPLRELPNVELWHATSPCRGTTEPLSITFDRPFDRHLLSRGIRVFGADGQVVDGMVYVDGGERTLSFTPNGPWTDANLSVVAAPELEDVAGNNFRDLLDHKDSLTTAAVSPTVRPIVLTSCSE